MSSFKVAHRKMKRRIRLAWEILTTQKKHWVFISLTEDELGKLIKEENFESNVVYCGLQRYNVAQIIRMLNNGIDLNEMILMKAEFEAKALYNLTEEKV